MQRLSERLLGAACCVAAAQVSIGGNNMTLTAYNHVPVPSFMYGTAWKKEATSQLVQLAVAACFTAIDTANQLIHYQEALVGEALQALERKGTDEGDRIVEYAGIRKVRLRPRTRRDGSAGPAHRRGRKGRAGHRGRQSAQLFRKGLSGPAFARGRALPRRPSLRIGPDRIFGSPGREAADSARRRLRPAHDASLDGLQTAP